MKINKKQFFEDIKYMTRLGLTKYIYDNRTKRVKECTGLTETHHFVQKWEKIPAALWLYARYGVQKETMKIQMVITSMHDEVEDNHSWKEDVEFNINIRNTKVFSRDIIREFNFSLKPSEAPRKYKGLVLSYTTHDEVEKELKL